MPQSLSNVLLHLVFSTKNCQPWLAEEIRPRVASYLAGVLKEQGHHPVEVGGYTDHVHLLFEMSRTQSIAQLVEHLKSGSSRWLKGEHQSLREFAWQSGYAVFSVGQSQRSRVQSYIQTQKDHHQTSSFQQEFRALLAGTMWCLTSATFGIDSGAHNRGGS